MDSRPFSSRWRGAGGVRPRPSRPLHTGSIDIAGIRARARQRSAWRDYLRIALEALVAVAAILLFAATSIGLVLFLGHPGPLPGDFPR
jgi:hypothetical protein